MDKEQNSPHQGKFEKNMQRDYSIEYLQEPAWEAIGRGLREYNTQQAGPELGKNVCFALYAPDKSIVGGVIGETHWGWLHIILLWVKEELRGRGYGHQLLMDSVSGTNTYVQHTDYDAAGRVNLRKLGADVLRTDYVYYPWNTQGGRLQYLKTGTPSNLTSMQYFTYSYDENGDVKTILAAKNSNQKQCFLYDALDRLTRGTTQLSDTFCQATHVGNGQYDESYAYDGTTGNLSSKGGQALSYGDPNHKHAATAWNGWIYTYDTNGNMQTRTYGGTTYTLTYDQENHLTGMTGGGVSATFTYDGDGNRVKGTIAGVTTTYIRNHFEWVSSTGNMKKYYYEGITRVAVRTGSANPLWLLGDHLGSTSKVANYDGLSEHSQQLYKPWGEKRYPTGAPTLPTTFRFTGQRSETGLGPAGGDGLMYYGARWYDGVLGRWIQPDSIIPEWQGVQAWDRYAYTSNNPVRYTDPTGHKNCEEDGYNCDEESRDESNHREDNEFLGYNPWDYIPVISDVRSVIRGTQVANWASEQPSFINQQKEYQSWQTNCYGVCHYDDSIVHDSGGQIGGPMPDVPLVDSYSNGMGQAVSGVTNLAITAIFTKISLSQTQMFHHGGPDWHLGLETKNNMNIIHVGNHPNYGIHVAFGAIKPFVADLHIYLQTSIPFIRIWRP